MGKRPPRKYREGFKFFSLDEAYDWGQQGQYYWWNGKAYHPSFLRGWQFMMFSRLVYCGQIKAAVTTDEWAVWEHYRPETKPDEEIVF